MSSNGPRRGASLYEFRDLDLLHKLLDEGDNQGWVETAHLARALGLTDEGVQSVAVRLSWMVRYRILERNPDQSGVWRVAPAGLRIVRARVKAATERDLDQMPAEQMVEVMAHVAGRYFQADPVTATMLRREFMYGTKARL